MTKPLMSHSRMTRLFGCGEQARQIYVLGRKMPPNTNLVLGSAVHHAAAAALRAKSEGKSIDPEDTARVAADHVLIEFASPKGLRLTPEEQAEGRDETRDSLAEEARGLARLYCLDVLPNRHPCMMPDVSSPEGQKVPGVEWRFVCEMAECSHDLLGFCDLVEDRQDLGGLVVRDLKVMGRSPSQGSEDSESDADSSEQLSVYCLAAQVWTGRAVAACGLDCLVRGSPESVDKAGRKRKAKPPEFRELITRRTYQDLGVALNRLAAAIHAFDAGIFIPADRSSWMCSKRWCEFAQDGSCSYFRDRSGIGAAMVQIPVTRQQEQTSHPVGNSTIATVGTTARRVVGPGSPEWDAVMGDSV